MVLAVTAGVSGASAGAATAGKVVSHSAPCTPDYFAKSNDVAGIASATGKVIERWTSPPENSMASIAAGWKPHNVKPKHERYSLHGVVGRLTVTKATDGSFHFQFTFRGATVFTGQAVPGASSGGHVTEVDVQLTLSLSAISKRLPGRPSGTLALTGSVIRDPSKPKPGLKRTGDVTLTNFLPNRGDVHGPRNGTYSWVREPGIGSTFSYSDSVILICPTDATHGLSDVTAVGRSYVATDGTVHGRADAKATGGWIPTGDSLLEGACSEATGQYAMKKLEDGSGNTVSGTTTGVSGVCDPIFGAFPSLTNNATDYDFSSTATFPGEW
jgi:hypothetical protein